MAKGSANSADPDRMPHYVASDLVLHCLSVIIFRVSGLKWVHPCPAKYIKKPHPFLIFSQSDYLIKVVDIDSHT